MASLEDVERKLEELLGRLDGTDEAITGSLRESLPEGRVLTVHVTDLDAHYWAEFADGTMGALRPGTREDAHVRVAVGSDDLVALVDRRAPLLPAFLSGRIRVQASFSDLMLMKKLLT